MEVDNKQEKTSMLNQNKRQTFHTKGHKPNIFYKNMI